MLDIIKEKIKEADFVLVGIGQEMAWKEEETFEGETAWLNEYKKAADIQCLTQKDEILSAYENLSELLKGKIYFIVTMNTDDVIFQSSLRSDQILSLIHIFSAGFTCTIQWMQFGKLLSIAVWTCSAIS